MITGTLVALQISIWTAVYLTGNPEAWTPLLLVPDRFSPLALLTAPFVHFSVLHLATNVALLWLVGRPLERSFGALPFLLLYVGSALFGGLMHLSVAILLPTQLGTPALGASGAVAGLMGAYAVRFAHRPVPIPLVGRTRLSVPAALLLWVAAETVRGATELRSEGSPMIGHWAHVGGFVFGLCLAQGMGVGRAAQVARQLDEVRRGRGTVEESAAPIRELLERGGEGELDAIVEAAAPLPAARRIIEEWIEGAVLEEHPRREWRQSHPPSSSDRKVRAARLHRIARQRWGSVILSPEASLRLGLLLLVEGESSLAAELLVTGARAHSDPERAVQILVRAGEIAERRLDDPRTAAVLYTVALEGTWSPSGPWRDRAAAALGRLRAGSTS